MRIRAVRIRDFKGVEVDLKWSRAMVFFGPNGAGKTNILEALAHLAHGTEPRLDPFDTQASLAAATLDVEFDLDESEEDHEICLRLLTSAESGSSSTAAVVIDEHVIRLDRRERDVKRVLREQVFARAADLPAVHRDEFRLILDHCLSSSRFRYVAGTGVSWLVPQAIDRPERVRRAAQRLSTASVLGSFPFSRLVQSQLDDASGDAVFLEVKSPDIPFPASVVCVAGDVSRLTFLRNEFERLITIDTYVQRRLRGAEAPDAWLESGEDGWTRVHPYVRALCEYASKRANEIAPTFLTERYNLVVEALPPELWATAGHRIRLGIEEVGGQNYDLSVAGSGILTWATIVLAEVAGRLPDERQELLAPSLDDIVEGPSTPHALEEEGVLRALRAELARQLLRDVIYLFDEPERNLHPLAQDEAARWLGRLALQGPSVVLATHAVPMLDLASEEASYFRVRRSDGKTYAEPISEDVIGRLVAATGTGVAPAQLIQLTRAFLIVEGKHDELVIDALYGDSLRQARIMMLPLRGADNVALLAEAELIQRFEIPLYILLDGIDAELVLGYLQDSRRISDKNAVPLRALARFLDHLPPDSRPEIKTFPHVDIVCAIPDDVVRRVLATKFASQAANAFPGWTALEDRWRETRRRGRRGTFKDLFLSSVGLESNSFAVVLREFLQELPPSSDWHTSLGDVLRDVIVSVARGAARS